MRRLSRLTSLLLGCVLLALGLTIVARKSPSTAVVAGTACLIALWWGVR